MDTSTERAWERVFTYGGILTEVRRPVLKATKPLTPFSQLTSQKFSSVLPKSYLRFVLAIPYQKVGITLDRLGFERTNQKRPDHVGPFGTAGTHYAFGGQGSR